MVDYIHGTNIPVSAIKGNIKGDAAYWSKRLSSPDVDINDTLFDLAYSTPFSGCHNNPLPINLPPFELS